MDNKIAELTDAIYKEGVEKGEQEAHRIIEDAKSKAGEIVAEAKKRAEEVVADANRQAEEQKRNAASEIRLSGQQALSAIRQQILDVVAAEVVDQGVSKSLDDPAVMKDMIVAIVENWKGGVGDETSLEVLLPEAKKKELEKSLVAALQKKLKKGVSVSFSRAISGGFQVRPQDGSFKVSLSDEDFTELFKQFLRPKAKVYLFGEGS